MRFRFSAFRDYFTKYRIKTRENRINLMNYLRTKRQKIIERQRNKLMKRMIFWSCFFGGSYLIYNQIYRKKMEINKMKRKLDNFYSNIMEKQILKDQWEYMLLKPTNLDQLTNLVSLTYRYHYKMIVRMDELTKREKFIICEQFGGKCIFINLSHLNSWQIDETNNTINVQSGASCLKVNQELKSKGYQPLFPVELTHSTIYDVIVNNLPLQTSELNRKAVSLELISASGQNFRSAGECNRYGQIPSLNSLFIGTGGIFALPSAVTLRLQKVPKNKPSEEHLIININDDNLKVDALRKLTEIDDHFIEVELSNSLKNQQLAGKMMLSCKQRMPFPKDEMTQCSQVTKRKGILTTPVDNCDKTEQSHHLLFSATPSIFQSFLLHFGRKVEYSYKNGLLKVRVIDPEDQEHMISIINQITGNNGVLVWCCSQELLLRIKPSLDSSEVGAELMRKIVQVRQGLDRRNIFYSHSRYEDYFAKSAFRRLTQLFW